MSVDIDCEILWNYLCLHHELKQSDVILVCGGHDIGVANRAIYLYRKKYAPKIVVSGGIVREFFNTKEKMLEADILGKIIISGGIDSKDVLLEREAKNTGENLEFTRKLLEDQNIPFNRIVIVQKPYALRRAWYLAKKKWANKEIIMDSEKIEFKKYSTLAIPKEKVINMMVGEIQRLIYSPQFGWIEQVDIPDNIINAYKRLCNLGYTDRLMSKEVIDKCFRGTQDNTTINIGV